jgi:predicted rRNA methylase YqxC with S4 and FtsJ domains
MNWIYKKLFKCRLCKSNELIEILDIGEVNNYTANTGVSSNKNAPNLNSKSPLTMHLCRKCSNIQLGEVFNPEFLYRNFRYESKITFGLELHFKKLADEIKSKLKIKKNDIVLDVGSNDGSFLKNFRGHAKIIGVEPGRQISEKANADGIFTLNSFFNIDLAHEIRKKYKTVKVIFCANTIANLDNLDEIFEGFKLVLSKNGYVLLETQSGIDVINKFLIDTIYHEHLNYFTVTALKKFAFKKGFRIDCIQNHSQKGGSIRVWMTHKENLIKPKFTENEANFLLRMEKTLLDLCSVKADLLKKVKKIKSKIQSIEGDIICFGSSVGSNTLLNLFFAGKKIHLILDNNPKVNKIPFDDGFIEVRKTSEYHDEYKNLPLVILPYRYFDQIIKNNKNISSKFIKLID